MKWSGCLDSGSLLYVDRLVAGVRNLGPGKRVVLWVQGCDLACRGCMTPELFSRRSGSASTVGEVAQRIAALARGHDGLTVSGGEPFEQAEAVAELLQELRRSTSLDFLVYSGYRLEELGAVRGAPALLAEADILIDGRFEIDQPTEHPWMGSANQRLHALTERARALLNREAPTPLSGRRTLHVGQGPAGELTLVGVPHRGFQRELRARLAKRGVELRRIGPP